MRSLVLLAIVAPLLAAGGLTTEPPGGSSGGAQKPIPLDKDMYMKLDVDGDGSLSNEEMKAHPHFSGKPLNTKKKDSKRAKGKDAKSKKTSKPSEAKPKETEKETDKPEEKADLRPIMDALKTHDKVLSQLQDQMSALTSTVTAVQDSVKELRVELADAQLQPKPAAAKDIAEEDEDEFKEETWNRAEFMTWHMDFFDHPAGETEWKKADNDGNGVVTLEERLYYEECCNLRASGKIVVSIPDVAGYDIPEGDWADTDDPTECREQHGGDIYSPSGRCYIKAFDMSTEANHFRKVAWRAEPDDIPELVDFLTELVERGKGGFSFDELMKFSGFQRVAHAVKISSTVEDIEEGAWWELIDNLEGDEVQYFKDLVADKASLEVQLGNYNMQRALHLVQRLVDNAENAAQNRAIPFIGQTLEADAMEALFTSGDLVLVDFYKEDCKACLQHAPHFAAVAEHLEGHTSKIKVVRINCSNNLGYCRSANPDGLAFPTVQVRQRGKMLSQYQPGSYFLESMMKWLDPVLGGRAMPAKKPAGRKKSGSKRIEL